MADPLDKVADLFGLVSKSKEKKIPLRYFVLAAKMFGYDEKTAPRKWQKGEWEMPANVANIIKHWTAKS